MNHTVRNTVARLLMSLLTASASLSAFGADSFRSVLLSDMADAMNMRKEILALPDGVHVGELSYSGKPISVVVENGTVSHLGYSVFTADHRKDAYSPFFDMVERFCLVEKLPMQRVKTVQAELREAGAHIDTGSLSMLPPLYNDQTVEFSLSNDNGKTYLASWIKNGKKVVEMDVPINYDLIHGTTMEENELMLISDLMEAAARGVSETDFTLPSVKREDLITLFPSNYYILPGESYFFDNMNANRYYAKADSLTFAPIYDEKFPLESLANVATSLEVPNDLSVKLKVIQYNFRHTELDIPLSAMVKYFTGKGCKPFFGLISRDNDAIVCELLMRNIDEGYCHVIKLTVNTPEGKEFSISSRMNPYVPVSKIKELFAEPTESEKIQTKVVRNIKIQRNK